MSEKQSLPNFLIAGMAKCATTTLAKAISQHPEVFISEHKEPRFLTSACGKLPQNGPKDHLVRQWYVQDFESYKNLFKNRKEKAVGEASADTLYFHQDTIPVIKKYLGSPKIIIIIRDPVKRAFSAYKHLVRDQRETLSFEEALQAERQRKQEGWELIYHYTSASRYAEGIEAFQANFDHVLILLNEDLKKDYSGTLKRVYEFLEVDPEVSIEAVPELNKSGKPKSRLLHTTMQTRGWLAAITRPIGRFFVRSPEKREKIRNRIKVWNLKDIDINPETEKELRAQFREDIHRTAAITGLNLTGWLGKDD